jgi:sugar phosphate isomerase/epimerase
LIATRFAQCYIAAVFVQGIEPGGAVSAPVTVPYAVNQWMTPHNSVFQDAEQYAACGATGIGLWEAKLGPRSEDGAVLEALEANGLRATYCSPRVWPILPGPLDDASAPSDVQARVDAICASIERFAAFRPIGVIVGGGRSGDPERPAGPVEPIEGALAQIADVAAKFEMRVGFELLGKRRGAPLHRFEDVVDLIDAVGRANVGILFDVIHSWCEPDLHRDLRRYVDRIDYVQVNDVRDPERSWCDRLLPGEGRGVAPDILATLLDSGYAGWYELEVFSDDGTFGNAFEDSLWAIPHEELLARGRLAFERVYAQAQERVARGMVAS